MSLNPWLPVPITARVIRSLAATAPPSPRAEAGTIVGNATPAAAVAVVRRKPRRERDGEDPWSRSMGGGLALGRRGFGRSDCESIGPGPTGPVQGKIRQRGPGLRTGGGGIPRRRHREAGNGNEVA